MMRLSSMLVLAVGVSATLVAAQPSAVRAAQSIGRPRVRIVATVRGGVASFAQDRRYLAWLLAGNGDGMVVMDNLRTGARVRVPTHPRDARTDFPPCLGPQGLALAGSRAYWEQRCYSNNTVDATLASASVRDRRLRGLGDEEVDRWMPSVSRECVDLTYLLRLVAQSK